MTKKHVFEHFKRLVSVLNYRVEGAGYGYRGIGVQVWLWVWVYG